MDNLHGGSISKREQEHNTVFFAGLAHWISAVGFAPVLSIPAFAIIVLTGGPVQSGVTPVLFVSILFGFLFPSIAMYAFVKIKGISYDNRESRLLPLLSVAVVYFIGALIVHEMAAPINTTILMFCYGTNTLMIYLISLKWKISVHSMGVAGPTTALVFAPRCPGRIVRVDNAASCMESCIYEKTYPGSGCCRWITWLFSYLDPVFLLRNFSFSRQC